MYHVLPLHLYLTSYLKIKTKREKSGFNVIIINIRGKMYQHNNQVLILTYTKH
jgi:hypothetical protein